VPQSGEHGRLQSIEITYGQGHEERIDAYQQFDYAIDQDGALEAVGHSAQNDASQSHAGHEGRQNGAYCMGGAAEYGDE
jgi:hypothetical protein